MELGAIYQTIGRVIALIRSAGGGFTQTTRGTSTAVTRTSAGLYVVTAAQPCTPAGAKVSLALHGATGAYGTVTPDGTGTAWTVATFVNTAGVSTATDVDFDLTIEQLDGT